MVNDNDIPVITVDIVNSDNRHDLTPISGVTLPPYHLCPIKIPRESSDNSRFLMFTSQSITGWRSWQRMSLRVQKTSRSDTRY